MRETALFCWFACIFVRMAALLGDLAA